MSSSPVVFYVSGHGFGHAARQTEIIRALLDQRDDIDVVVKTETPRWFFERAGLTRCRVVPTATDAGVTQIDSLSVDVEASIDSCARFHDTLATRADDEARDLDRIGARLVVGDIPPLACVAGARAGVPTIAIGNFTWDWIYAGYRETTERAPTLVETLARSYADATSAWRLPLHGGFAAFSEVVDMPMVARQSSRNGQDTKRRLGLPTDRRLALFAFGRYGAPGVEWSRVAALRGYHILFTSGDHTDGTPTGSTFTTFDEETLYADGVRYEDLMAAVDVVITKPGFGIVAECAANDTAMLYTDRGRFPEYDILTAGMPSLIRCAHISHEQLFAGRWQESLDQLLGQPRPAPIDLTGAGKIAGRLSAYL